MCTYSMVTDHYIDKWYPYTQPPYIPYVQPPWTPGTAPPFTSPGTPPQITQSELDEFRRLLERAREYDKRNSEPDCELAEKREKLKKIADQLGVDISFV